MHTVKLKKSQTIFKKQEQNATPTNRKNPTEKCGYRILKPFLCPEQNNL
jgi:hypothetical protein